MRCKITNSAQKCSTIKSPLTFCGKGLHSGLDVVLTLKSAKCGEGIVFVRTDVSAEKNNKIHCNFNNVTDLTFNTTISNADGISVSTVEHLLAALWSAQISDCLIEINNQEAPIMDGSSLIFLNGLKTAATTIFDASFDAPMPLATIEAEVFVSEKDSSITALPPLYQGQLLIDFEIDFKCKQVGAQRFVFEPSMGDSFGSEIAHAKTFALKKDYDYLRSIGYAKGGEESNGILLETEKIFNPQYLTYANDFVRHKILDLLGDFYTSGHLFSGRFICKKSGHKLTNTFLKTLFNTN